MFRPQGKRWWSGLAAAPHSVGVVLGLFLGLRPQPMLAHEKWFTDRAVHGADWSLVLSGRTLLALGVGLAAVALFGRLQHLVGDPHWPRLPFSAQLW